jgi:hypothetical protein
MRLRLDLDDILAEALSQEARKSLRYPQESRRAPEPEGEAAPIP